MTVKDSVVMEDNLHIYEKLSLEKDAYLRRDVFVGNKLVVDSESYFNGNAYFNQKVILYNLDLLDSMTIASFGDSLSVSDKPDILFVDENGEVKKGEGGILKSLLYQPKYCNEPTMAAYANFSPTWANGPNKIFLAECPPTAKVGIGTSNPTHKLHTAGDVLFTSALQVGRNVGIGGLPSTFSMLKVNNPAAATGIEVDMSTNTVDYQKVLYMRYAHEETELIKVENATTGHIPFILESSGRLVISNETEKILQLEPSGLLRARRIRVDSDTWADFVFDKNYKLMPLNELEQYVVTENHLPNVPSAQDVIQNGVDLVEMNKILLQKVEELTLYIINQEKRLNQLASQVLLK
jgi:hypothetical protein